MSAAPTASSFPSEVPPTFFAMHAALRADVERLTEAADAVARGDADLVPALVDRVAVFVEMLHMHNGLEDELVVPDVLERRAGACSVVCALEAQHALLDTLAYRVRDRAAVLDPTTRGWRTAAVTVAEDLGALADALIDHLDDEERDLVPHWCAAFTQAEQDAIAGAVRDRIGDRMPLMVGWLAHVLGDDAMAEVLATTGAAPPRVPAAWRAAFTHRPAAAL